MNKKHLFGTMTLALALGFALVSCDKSKTQSTESEETSSTTTKADTKVAYVEVDSIMSQYKFCKEYSLVLQKKGQNIQNTLAQKQQQLQAAAVNFQQKIQQNAYTREQAEAIQMNLQKQERDLQALSQRLNQEFQIQTEKYNNALRDSIQHYLATYNKDKKFGLILSKAGDNILYADKSYDITKEVIAGLNKAYTSSPNLSKDAKK